MVFHSLHALSSKAERVLLYSDEWYGADTEPDEYIVDLLALARNVYDVRIKPIQLLGVDGETNAGTIRTASGFESSITKLRLWELEEYERIIHFDSDVVVQHHLDELFFLPPTPMAMPRENWIDRSRDDWALSSQLMVLQPDASETKAMWETLQSWRLDPNMPSSQHYDNELINNRFASSALVLPHRPYLLQTNEIRMHEHEAYMGQSAGPSTAIGWDPLREIKQAKLIHFDDWPLPKPWVMWPSEGLAEMLPECDARAGSCFERDLWRGLYDDFRQRRKDVCKISTVPAPDWRQWKSDVDAI